MNTLSQTTQIVRLFYLILRYDLGELLFQKKYRFLRWLNPFYRFFPRRSSRGKRLLIALQKAGPLFVKFGQILSTRQDLLPKDIIQHLSTLQDNAHPFSAKIAQKIIDRETKNQSNTIFSHIEKHPLASASIAQVHAATLYDGTEVVIKLLRPQIKSKIIRDLAVLYWGSRFFKPWGRKMVEQIDLTLMQEVNLINEAAHAQQLEENAKARQVTNLTIPKMYWEYSTENLLVMQRIYGISIRNTCSLRNAGVNLTLLAKNCVKLFFEQIFQDNYFHADLHPGNIAVNVNNPHTPIIELMDFGIVGSLPLKDRRYIAENITALIDKNYRRVAQLHHEAAWIPAHIPEIAFAYAIEKICDPILDKPLQEISLAQLLLGLLHAAKQYEIQLQPQLLLLQKTLLNIESLCRLLDPHFNIWETIQPILKTWLKQQLSPFTTVKMLTQHLYQWIKSQS